MLRAVGLVRIAAAPTHAGEGEAGESREGRSGGSDSRRPRGQWTQRRRHALRISSRGNGTLQLRINKKHRQGEIHRAGRR